MDILGQRNEVIDSIILSVYLYLFLCGLYDQLTHDEILLLLQSKSSNLLELRT